MDDVAEVVKVDIAPIVLNPIAQGKLKYNSGSEALLNGLRYHRCVSICLAFLKRFAGEGLAEQPPDPHRPVSWARQPAPGKPCLLDLVTFHGHSAVSLPLHGFQDDIDLGTQGRELPGKALSIFPRRFTAEPGQPASPAPVGQGGEELAGR